MGVFLLIFCEVFNNTCFEEELRTEASEITHIFDRNFMLNDLVIMIYSCYCWFTLHSKEIKLIKKTLHVKKNIFYLISWWGNWKVSVRENILTRFYPVLSNLLKFLRQLKINIWIVKENKIASAVLADHGDAWILLLLWRAKWKPCIANGQSMKSNVNPLNEREKIKTLSAKQNWQSCKNWSIIQNHGCYLDTGKQVKLDIY